MSSTETTETKAALALALADNPSGQGVVMSETIGPLVSPPTSTPWVPVWPVGGGLTITVVPTMVTSLPVSPTDGQEVLLVDSLTAPNYVWHLRYVASFSGTNKWVCVGGFPYELFVTGPLTLTLSSTFADIGLPITIPNSGEWVVGWGFSVTGTPSAAYVLEHQPVSGLPYPLAGAGTGVTVGYSTYHSASLSLAAGNVVKPQARCAQGGSWTFNYRQINILPRVIR